MSEPTKQTAPSPLPWRVLKYPENSAGITDVLGATGRLVMTGCSGIESHDAINAEFICKACNSHEALLAALKQAARVMEAFDIGVDPEIWKALSLAEAGDR